MSTVELQFEPVSGQKQDPTLREIPENALDSSPVGGTLASISYLGNSSPDFQNSSRFDFSSHRKDGPRMMGNSASGKILPPKNVKKQEMPKSVFSSVIVLPKLKQQEGHKTVAEQYKGKNPKTFEMPSYRGYISDKLTNHSSQILVKKRIYDLVDSRYRLKNPLKEDLHLTWALTKRVERQNGDMKLDIRDLENLKVDIQPKTEEEYIKVCVDVSADEDAYDQEEKELIGKNAVREYTRHYQLLNKVMSENQARKVKNSLYTNILSGISRQKLMPLKMDVVKPSGHSDEINNK